MAVWKKIKIWSQRLTLAYIIILTLRTIFGAYTPDRWDTLAMELLAIYGVVCLVEISKEEEE